MGAVLRYAGIAGLLLTLASCSGGSSDTAPVPSGGASASPAISAEQARQVLGDYVSTVNKAVAAKDPTAWETTATGPLRKILTAQAVMAGGKPPADATISLSNPALYVPRLATGPRWFATAVEQGRQEVLLVFVQDQGGWLPVHRLPFQNRPPEIAVDAQGYAMTATGAPGTVRLPAAHAAYLNGTPDSVVPDTYSRSRPAGHYAPDPYPAYALRTTDGGALVWYALDQSAQYAAGSAPTQVKAYLGGKRQASQATWIWQAIAYVPMSGDPTILGEQVALTAASPR
jgi:hypothetical protein